MNNLAIVISRSAAVALLFGCAIVLYFLIVAPIVNEYSAKRHQAVMLQEQIARYKAIADRQGGLRKQLSELESTNELTDLYWTGGTAAVAGANLQMLVNQLVVKSGGSVQSIANLTDKKSEQAATIAIKVLFSAEMAAIQKILHEIERQQPILFVDTIELRKRRVRKRRKAVSNDQNTKLQVVLNISGYFLEN
jgi:hypothetical protein